MIFAYLSLLLIVPVLAALIFGRQKQEFNYDNWLAEHHESFESGEAAFKAVRRAIKGEKE